MKSSSWEERLEDAVLAPIRNTSRRYWYLVGGLTAVVLFAVYAFTVQARQGLIVTAMRDRISWGLYIVMFVFFIGISMAGTMISAILRVANARWKASITRVAELITAVALITAAVFILVDMGRPERLLSVFRYGRWQSPIMWDVLGLMTYLTASIIYVYFPMIPDLAFFRDKFSDGKSKVRAVGYRVFALNWRGTPRQHAFLAKGIAVLMIAIIPIAVSMHTVTAWIFSMTLRTAWNTALFGVYFVAGAVFSGIAALIILMAILRKTFNLQEYITDLQFKFLGYLMAAMASVMVYFNISEYATAGFKLAENEDFIFRQLFIADFRSYFMFYFFGGLLVPIVVMLVPRFRNLSGMLVAAVFVDISMWIERYIIVVAGLRPPLMPYEPSDYFPTWVEWSIMAGGFALFVLLIVVAVKVVPILSVWEIKEERELALKAPQMSEEGVL